MPRRCHPNATAHTTARGHTNSCVATWSCVVSNSPRGCNSNNVSRMLARSRGDAAKPRVPVVKNDQPRNHNTAHLINYQQYLIFYRNTHVRMRALKGLAQLQAWHAGIVNASPARRGIQSQPCAKRATSQAISHTLSVHIIVNIIWQKYMVLASNINKTSTRTRSVPRLSATRCSARSKSEHRRNIMRATSRTALFCFSHCTASKRADMYAASHNGERSRVSSIREPAPVSHASIQCSNDPRWPRCKK